MGLDSSTEAMFPSFYDVMESADIFGKNNNKCGNNCIVNRCE